MLPFDHGVCTLMPRSTVAACAYIEDESGVPERFCQNEIATWFCAPAIFKKPPPSTMTPVPLLPAALSRSPAFACVFLRLGANIHATAHGNGRVASRLERQVRRKIRVPRHEGMRPTMHLCLCVKSQLMSRSLCRTKRGAVA